MAALRNCSTGFEPHNAMISYTGLYMRPNHGNQVPNMQQLSILSTLVCSIVISTRVTGYV